MDGDLPDTPGSTQLNSMPISLSPTHLCVGVLFATILSTANSETVEALVAAELKRAGLHATVKEVEARKANLLANGRQASAKRQEAMRSAITIPVPPQVVGFMVRFRDPGVRKLAESNLPPPSTLSAELTVAAGYTLVYHRAMSGGVHVYRFSAPLSMESAEPALESVRRISSIEIADLDITVTGQQSASADPYLSSQWNMKGMSDGYAGGIDAVRSWPTTFGTSFPVVAVVDTGVLPHPEFTARVLPGYDFVSDLGAANDGSARDANAEDPGTWQSAGECGPGSPAKNSSWHGTHVAGIVAADGGNGSGIAGVSWKSRILPVRVLGKCSSSISDILDGLQWAAGLPVPGVPANANPAHIINLSLGGFSPTGCPWLIQESINRALGQGALLVVAAGNDKDDAARYTPANCKGVLTVFATDHLGYHASYTNFDFKGIGIAAPGGDARYYGPGYGILSTVGSGTTSRGDPSYGEMNGTSMAAPHVSGVAALALSVNPNLSGAELAAIMQLASASFPANSKCAALSICGAGIVNAYATTYVANALKDRQLIYEFYNSGANHYFRTGSKGEASGVNRGSAGPGWYDSVNYFYAWNTQSAGTYPVCRFYSPRANSHFYTASAAECAGVKTNQDWNFEGISFYAKIPQGGGCTPGDTPVYRAYNNRHASFDMNHRFTTDLATYQEMLRIGWLGEGIALCV